MNTAQKIIATDFDVNLMDGLDMNQITFDVVVREDQDGNPISGFRIVGKNSDLYLGASNEVRKENLKRSSKRSTQIDSSTDEGAEIVIKTVSSNDKAVVLAVIVDWFGFSANGEPLAFNKSIAEKMLAKFPTWQAKIVTALEKDGNFMKV